jgi:hypothetical protein
VPGRFYTDGSLDRYELALGPLALRTLASTDLTESQEIRLP